MAKKNKQKDGFGFLIKKACIEFRMNGIKGVMRKTKNKILHKSEAKEYIKLHVLSEDERKRQQDTVFDRNIKFSILVPLWNTPIKYLEEMIDSVIAQTYANWELCLADGSDDAHKEVGERCLRYSAQDKRIVYKKLKENKGIAGNTNECYAMATGEFIALFDHDDVLHPAALYEMMVKICEEDADFVYTDEATFEGDDITDIITFHFKPDFAIDNLRANNYICHFSSFSAELMSETELFRKEYDGSQDHDMILRLTANAKKVCHIPKLLYFWRSHPNSVASDINSKTYAIDSGKRAVKDSLLAEGIRAEVESSRAFPTIYRLKYELTATPKISILIPNKDHIKDLTRCIDSIREMSTYTNYEIIVIENNSVEEITFRYYEYLESLENVRVVRYTGGFNYAAINNFGAGYATGDLLLLLNNDTKVITPEWMEEMLMYAQRKDVGAVGAKLYYEDDTIQHAGIVIGLGAHRAAGHTHYRCTKDNLGYMGKLFYAQNVSAVTGACLLVKKNLYDELGGLDEQFTVAFNDVDFCLRIREKGYLIVFTPYAELYHYESKSRGFEDTKEKKERFEGEVKIFRERYKELLRKGDPYYNPNFTLNRADYSLRSKDEGFDI
ncbi:MAG: glycosyltransferase [Lachnospiraceae bacterium]|nr:glycosyltransferase [Lachnospiraceae bacterium]